MLPIDYVWIMRDLKIKGFPLTFVFSKILFLSHHVLYDIATTQSPTALRNGRGSGRKWLENYAKLPMQMVWTIRNNPSYEVSMQWVHNHFTWPIVPWFNYQLFSHFLWLRKKRASASMVFDGISIVYWRQIWQIDEVIICICAICMPIHSK